MKRRVGSARWAWVAPACALTCCSPSSTKPTGQVGPIQPGNGQAALAVASADEGLLIQLDGQARLAGTTPVGREPTRVARAGNRVYVSVRAERNVAVLEPQGDTLAVVARIPTGAEPYGVVATDQKVFVAASVAGTVDEYDAKTLEKLRSWVVPGEPRWLAMHPSKQSLYAGGAYGGAVTRIDLATGATERLTLPTMVGFASPSGPTKLTPRVTGDMVTDGHTLYIPMLYVDNTTPIPDVSGTATVAPPMCPNGNSAGGAAEPLPSPPVKMDPGAPTPSVDGGAQIPVDPPVPFDGGTDPGQGGFDGGAQIPVDPPVPPPGFGCGGGGYNAQKMNPVVAAMPVDQSGKPDSSSPAQLFALSGSILWSDGQLSPANGYAGSLQLAQNGQILFATIEGANAVLALDLGARSAGASGGTELPVPVSAAAPNGAPGAASDEMAPPMDLSNAMTASFIPTVTILTGAGPRGVALLDDHRGFVYAGFDRTIEALDVDAVRAALDAQSTGSGAVGSPVGIGVDVGVTNGKPLPPGVDDAAPAPTPATATPADQQLRTTSPVSLGDRAVPVDVDLGRRLFFATNNPVMATVGAAVSCGTCHFDGRTDGVTWSFVRGQRQTPMLAVGIQNALPVGWAGNVPTVADEGFNTSQKLMGGHGIAPEQTSALQAFLYSERLVDAPNAGSTDAQVKHGAAVFAQVGCVSCHNGPAHTNNQVYSMLRLDRVKTRPLTGIVASAPYFHDGSAATLSEVVDRASRGEMGPAFVISDADKADLVAYLKSL